MKNSDELFLLIKSLSPSEKRYFKIFAAQSNKKDENNYVLLFDVIDRFNDEDYGEDLLKHRLRKHAFVKQLHVTKNYLCQLILKSLRNYYNISADSKLQELLKDAELLSRKQLYNQCEKILTKAAEYAEQNEKYIYLYEIYRFKEKIADYTVKDFDERMQRLDEYSESRKQILRKIENAEEFRSLFNKIHIHILKYGTYSRTAQMDDELNALMNTSLLSDESKALTTDSLRYYFQIYNWYYSLHNDVEKAFAFSKKQMQLFEEKLIYRRNNLRVYFLELINFIVRCIYLPNHQLYKKHLDKLINAKKEYADIISPEQIAEIENYAILLPLTYYKRNRLWAEAEEFISAKENIIPELENNISKKPQLTSLIYYSAYIFYMNGKYRKALQWINKLLTEYDEHASWGIRSYSRILRIILYYELGDTDFLGHVVKSTYRYLLSKERLFESEKVVMRHLRKLPVTDETTFFKSLHEELLPFYNNKYEEPFFDNLDLVEWAAKKTGSFNIKELSKK
jgi:hypothetical protein